MRKAVAGPVVVVDPAAAKAVVEASLAAVVAADKVVAAAVSPVVAAAKAVVARAAAVVVDVRPEAVAAAVANSSHSSGASHLRGAPFFY